MKKDLNDPLNVFSSIENKNNLENSTNIKTFIDYLLSIKGQYISVYWGDLAETVQLEETSIPMGCVICGKLIDVLDRVIVIECLYIDKSSNKIETGNIIYMNQFQIKMLTLLDGKGSIQDIFLHSKDAEHIRRHLISMHGPAPKLKKSK